MKSEPEPNNRSAGRARIGLLTSRASRLGGGVFESVVAHARALRAYSDFEPIVFAPADRQTPTDKHRLGEVELVTVPRFGPATFAYAPGLVDRIVAADIDVLHLHGIWQFTSLCGAQWAARTKRPYVISPHGMLDPWITSRGRWKKALARPGYEHRSWREAALFHALTQAEAADIARNVTSIRGKPRIEVVPNPIEVAPELPPKRASRMMLYIGRIHPKKNLVNLLDAWTLARRPESGDRLCIAGWGDKPHVESLETKLKQLGDPSIEFVGPVYGEAKRDLFDRARFLVLPSLSEGLPMAILEAWAAGTPCIMSAACNLPDGFAHGAALETGVTPDSIAAALRAASALSDSAWTAMSEAARRLAVEHFSPSVVTRRWRAIYATLV